MYVLNLVVDKWLDAHRCAAYSSSRFGDFKYSLKILYLQRHKKKNPKLSALSAPKSVAYHTVLKNLHTWCQPSTLCSMEREKRSKAVSCTSYAFLAPLFDCERNDCLWSILIVSEPIKGCSIVCFENQLAP